MFMCVHVYTPKPILQERHLFCKDVTVIQKVKQWHPPLVNVKGAKYTNDNN